MTNDQEELILEEMGWTIECHSPFEIRHEDGSFASMQAAYMVVPEIIEEWKEMQDDILSKREIEKAVEFYKKHKDKI